MVEPKTLLNIIENSEFFDADHYSGTYPDVAYSGFSAAEHYLHVGARLGRNPGPDFDTTAYLNTYLDVSARGENPLVHFEMHGRGERRHPKPLCDGQTSPAAPGQTKVDVVVPVHNALEHVKACLTSLSECENHFPMRILVVNDGSNKATSNWLRKACTALDHERCRFQLIEHPENQGYTKAVNIGLEMSDAAYVVALNSDTIVTPLWLDGLIRCMRSDPDLGIVGPLSNAASWQNVPDLYGPDKKFAINALPEGIDATAMAQIVSRASRRTYPRSPFVNGFCYMILRAVLDAVGYMDEHAFPVGYGEENDFCIRVQDAGFGLAFADDTYVFHAKSKSFGTARRDELSKAGTATLRNKHGSEKFDALVRQVGQTGTMDEIRARIRAAAACLPTSSAAGAMGLLVSQKILFILNVRGGGGGGHSIIQEVEAMRRLGITARVAIREDDFADYMRLYSDIEQAQDLFVTFTPETLIFVAQGYDIAVATIFTSVKLVARIVDHLPWVLPAYYAQDYEPMFFDEDSKLWREAHASYTRIPEACVFAKTHWIGQMIESNHSVKVHKVEPSIDHSVYSLTGPSFDNGTSHFCVAAMIRPKTPRRGAERTMEFLAMLKAEFADKISIRIFGCDSEAPDFQGLKQDFEFTNHGVLTRPEVAKLLRSSDVFVDLSDYQAFGRTGLEAMACGAVPVGPKAGGGYEYAVNGVNALVVDTLDIKSSFTQLCSVLRDMPRLARMRLEAVQTAAGYSARRAATSELLVFATALNEWRRKHPKPERTRVTIIPGQAPDGVEPWPGLGNERLPGPYCHEDFTQKFHLHVEQNETLPAPGTSDIVILQSDPSYKIRAEFKTWHKEWRSKGGYLIYDTRIDPGASDISHIGAKDPDLTARNQGFADAADLITLPHPGTPSDYTSKIKVVGDFLDQNIWDLDKAAPRPASTQTPLTVGYFGVPGNTDDLLEIKEALERVQARFGFRFEVIGTYQYSNPVVGSRVGYLKRYKNPDFTQPHFMKWLKERAQWDIVILPVTRNSAPPVYLTRKFMQCAALEAAIICSDDPGLSQLARDGENCLAVPNDPASWEAAIERLVNDIPLRQKLVENAHQDARTQWSVQSNIDIYQSVLQKVANGQEQGT